MNEQKPKWKTRTRYFADTTLPELIYRSESKEFNGEGRFVFATQFFPFSSQTKAPQRGEGVLFWKEQEKKVSVVRKSG